MEGAVVFAFSMVGAIVNSAADAAVASFILAHNGASFLKIIPGHGCPGLCSVCALFSVLCLVKQIQIDAVFQRSEDAVQEVGDGFPETRKEVFEIPAPGVRYSFKVQ